MYSTIFYAADGRKGVSKFEEEAMADIKVWIADYKEYWNNLKNIGRSGTEAKRIKQYIDSNYLKTSADNGEFPRDIKLPFVNDQGEIYFEFKPFESLDELITFRDLKEQEFVSSFAVNALDEDKSKENEALGEIARIDPTMVTIISDYLSKVDQGVETLQSIGSIPKYDGLEGFIESLDSRY